MRITYGKNVYGKAEIDSVVTQLKKTTQMGKSVNNFEKGIANCKAYSGFTLEKEDLVDWKELFRIFN